MTQKQSAQAERLQQRMRRIADAVDRPPVDIEPLKKCLHGRSCVHLDAPGMVSPMCELSVCGIFELRKCPIGLWWI
jgi:hypothetical protein